MKKRGATWTRKCKDMDYKEITDFIHQLYGTEDFVPLSVPRFVGNEKKYLEEDARGQVSGIRNQKWCNSSNSQLIT